MPGRGMRNARRSTSFRKGETCVKPITNMAFYCCGVRMEDAASERPLCGDAYAQRFMCEHGQRIHALFCDEKNTHASMLVRHRIIDDFLRETLAAAPATRIITIGAGFDSRPYRLQGGHWIELDEAPVLAWKEERLPAAHCDNPLQRVAIDFNVDTLADKLAPFAGTDPAVLVVEGVFIYLTEQEIRSAIDVFQRLFPSHRLICDLVSREMVNNYGQSLHAKIQTLGTCFQPVDHPEAVFTLHGYGIRDAVSIVERAADFGVHPIPKLMLRYLFNGDVMGNAVYVFEPADPYGDLVI